MNQRLTTHQFCEGRPENFFVPGKTACGFTAKYASDGMHCPGHPDWQPGDTRRALRADKSPSNVSLRPSGDSLWFVVEICGPFNSVQLDAVTAGAR